MYYYINYKIYINVKCIEELNQNIEIEQYSNAIEEIKQFLKKI